VRWAGAAWPVISLPELVATLLAGEQLRAGADTRNGEA
jgi:hypothetical protein